MPVKAEKPKQQANRIVIFCPCCEQRIFLFIGEFGDLLKVQAYEGDHKNPIKDD